MGFGLRGSLKSFMKTDEKGNRYTITGDDYGLRGYSLIVHRNRRP